ncbi:MAG: sulfite exporter TauE/SafE family protein [Acidimicrobiales bacterium]
MSLWAVLVTGLFAGGASCAAVQGGLLAAVVARRHPEPATAAGKSKGRGRTSAPPGQDAVPVGSFLAGKLVTHTVLGALLGLLGDTVQLGVKTRAWVQIGAGLLMVVLALDLFGVKAVRWMVPTPPAAWGRLVRRNARWSSGLAPAVLGGATILIPCGVTLGMEFLAVASGSALAGAAIMATFVVGTSPLFAAIGYAARRSTAVLRGRLGVLAAAAVLIAGLVSVNTGLVLADSSFTLTSALRSVTGGDQSTQPEAAGPLPVPGPDGVQHVTLTATGGGYSPSVLRVRAGVLTTLTVHTDGLFGCTRAFVIPSTGLQEYLPETGDTAFDLGSLEPGRVRFTCAMGMYSGSIEVIA